MRKLPMPRLGELRAPGRGEFPGLTHPVGRAESELEPDQLAARRADRSELDQARPRRALTLRLASPPQVTPRARDRLPSEADCV